MMTAARGSRGEELLNMGAESRSKEWGRQRQGWNINGGSQAWVPA